MNMEATTATPVSAEEPIEVDDTTAIKRKVDLPMESPKEFPPELTLTLVASAGVDVEPTVELVPKPNDDLIVFARTPGELEHSQGEIIGWVTQTLALHRRKMREAEANLKAAIDAKVKTAPWRHQVTLAKRRITYYDKVRQALEAGYFIVPDFPINVIAVRTKRKEPTKGGDLVEYRHHAKQESPQGLPQGVGEYVNPEKFLTGETKDVTYKDHEGKSGVRKEHWFRIWGEFAEIDFPIRLVRPEVLESYGKAAKEKLFDAIGIMPDNRKDRDPMIIGTIEMNEGAKKRRVSFLVAWWIPVSGL
jgi:hypothetical protein